jgi:formylglycine-generating enzyme required for sulfatase activity
MFKGRILKRLACLTVFFFLSAVLSGYVPLQKDEDILLKARMLIKEGNLDAAVHELNEVVETLTKTIPRKIKELAEAHYLLARVYKIVKMEAKYKHHLKKSFEIYPSLSIAEPDPEIRQMMNRVKEQLKREESKKKTVEKVGEPPKTRIKRKKKFPLLLVLAGAAVVTAVVLLLKKKKKDGTGNYDTEVLGIQWVDIPAGQFSMGDNFNEGWIDEQPVHSVYLDAYKISRYEITFDQYDIFCEDTGRNKPDDYGWGREGRPVVDVTWDDAVAFCGWLAHKTGKNIHLPSEAQWEKAARGTGQVKYPWGNTPPSCDRINYDRCRGRTMPVGSFPSSASPYEVHDMAGNVWEWCSDWYDVSYYSGSPANNPPGPAGGTQRVIRGGGWASSADYTRAANRDSSFPSSAINWLGFRICRD